MYEKVDNFSSLDPKISLSYNPIDQITLRISRGTSFTMPSMAQMYSSDINLGSVRDLEGSLFVRQARIGNPDLKPATSTNSNFGFIYDSDINRFSIDYWKIDYRDRIEAESSQAILDLDPQGPSITRNENGELIAVTTTYFNEESTLISGIDFSYEQIFDLNDNGILEFVLKGTSFLKFLTPDQTSDGTETVLENRIGKFNFDTHTHALPRNRINSFLTWKYKEYETGFNARYISSYENNRSIPESALNLGYRSKVDSFLVFDLSFELPIGILFNDVSLDGKFALINLFDEDPPLLYDAPDFSFDTRVHDPRGRMLNIQFELGLMN